MNNRHIRFFFKSYFTNRQCISHSMSQCSATSVVACQLDTVAAVACQLDLVAAAARTDPLVGTSRRHASSASLVIPPLPPPPSWPVSSTPWPQWPVSWTSLQRRIWPAVAWPVSCSGVTCQLDLVAAALNAQNSDVFQLYEPVPLPVHEPIICVGFLSGHVLCRVPLIPCYMDGS